MTVHIREIVENLPDLVNLHRGAGAATVSDLQTGATAQNHSLIFVASKQHLQEALESRAQAWVVHKDLIDKIPPTVPTVLASANPQLAMATIAKRFFPLTKHHQPIAGAKIHPSAQIAKTAQIGPGCTIGPGAVIGENCEIGEDSIIGANTVIEPDARIGARCHLHPLVFIGHSCQLGDECEVHPNTTIGSEGFGYAQDKQFNSHRITHYGRVVLEDRVHVGAGVQIDRGTYQDSRIGSGTKIDNHCHFGHNIVIGKNCLITGGMITAGSATIGNYCVFGGRTTMAGHITVADKVQIGGLSGITKSVTKAGEYSGMPLQELRDALRTRMAMRHLPKLLVQMRKVMRQLGIPQDDKDQEIG
ncbi:MAG TPA: UDP-3-O-(3-hydroxymyristoyl)glucosamine N-acyltransferase [Bdellovibrionales bacterium]|nr:UDP-3-O-(3-hydroxymyristoyl)glucosamine N-acyltransferase [Bdellovibrionales bacterium]